MYKLVISRSKTWSLLEDAIVSGVRLGIRRAYKHSDHTPPIEEDEEAIVRHSLDATMEEITESFELLPDIEDDVEVA